MAGKGGNFKTKKISNFAQRNIEKKKKKKKKKKRPTLESSAEEFSLTRLNVDFACHVLNRASR